MTGRGDVRFFHPSATPAVTIGLTINTSSPILQPTNPTPFIITVSARIITSPQPASPITLCTHLNPLSSLHSRSFSNIKCVSPDDSSHKRIEIWPHGWPHYVWDPENLRASLPFVSLRPNEVFEVKHEVERAEIVAERLEAGEKYRVELTNKGLGTKWWAFGSLDEHQETRLREWREREENEGEDENGKYVMGENPNDLALVIEKGEAEFAIE